MHLHLAFITYHLAFSISSLPPPASAQGILPVRRRLRKRRRLRCCLQLRDTEALGTWAARPQAAAKKLIHRLRPSAVARRSVDVLRKRHAPRASAFSIGGCAKSDQGESTPTVKSLLSCRGPWVTSTLTLRRRLAARSSGDRARQGKRATVSAGDNAQRLCGKNPSRS